MATHSVTLSSAKEPRLRSVWNRRLSVFLESWDGRIGGIVLVALLLIAVLPQSIWPAQSEALDLAARNQPPQLVGGDSDFPFGTDSLGRDLLIRIVIATRLTLIIAGSAMLISTIVGSVTGLLAGYFRGRTDTIVSRVVDIFLSFPILLLVLALISALGQSSWSVILVLGIAGWAGFTRIVRSSTLTLAELEYVQAAKSIGATDSSILFRHLLPNIASPIIVLSTLNFATFILMESAISFLGLGPAPPQVTWGGIIGDGRAYMYDAWWSTFFPGAAIVIAVLAFNLVGDSIRDAFDPLSQPRS